VKISKSTRLSVLVRTWPGCRCVRLVIVNADSSGVCCRCTAVTGEAVEEVAGSVDRDDSIFQGVLLETGGVFWDLGGEIEDAESL